MNGNNLEWEPRSFAPFNPVVYIGTAVTFMLLLGMAIFWRTGEHHASPALDMGILAVSATAASPIAWDHHYGILLPVFAVAFPVALTHWNKRRTLMLLFAGAYLLSGTYFDSTAALAGTAWNFLQSHMLLGALIMLLLLYRLRYEESRATFLYQSEETRARQRGIVVGELENAELRPGGNLQPILPDQGKSEKQN